MKPQTALRQQQEREDRLFKEIDNLMIADSGELDKYDGVNFTDQVRPANTWNEDLHERLFGEITVHGHSLPWSVASDKFRLRPGELTIWAGINGHGKSLILNQIMLSAMRQGAKVCIASLELHPVETLKRMACQFNGISEDKISAQAVDEMLEFVTGKLWLYAEVGDVEPHRIVALSRYARAEIGADHIVVDSLMKCGTMESDYAAEKRLINSLQNVAKQTGIHIHVVAHSRKLKDETQIMGKFDVVGSGMITNMADNVISVSRNKSKEAEARKQNPKQEILDKPDAYLLCDKQRHGQWEGAIGLWFHKSGQFLANNSGRVIDPIL